MNSRRNKTKVFFNVLTGAIKILSENGRINYGKISESHGSPRDRLKFTIALLKTIDKLKPRRTILTEARRNLIKVQISCQRR